MTEAGNTIIFSKGNIITSDNDGKIANAAIKVARPENTTELEKRNGVYTFDMWLDTAAGNYQKPGVEYVDNNGNYQNIASISQDFAWLEDDVM